MSPVVLTLTAANQFLLPPQEITSLDMHSQKHFPPNRQISGAFLLFEPIVFLLCGLLQFKRKQLICTHAFSLSFFSNFILRKKKLLNNRYLLGKTNSLLQRVSALLLHTHTQMFRAGLSLSSLR